MFKIARTAKQIINVVRNVPKSVSAGINSSFKYNSQSKGYVEDAAYEFTFLKALPSQSINASIQVKFKNFNLNPKNIEEVTPTQLLDPAYIRKHIYARFAEEIGARESTREHIEDFTTNDITDEFKMFKEQGYDFAATRQVLQNRNQDTNQSPKSMHERMKELSISGFFSSYAGEPFLRENLKKMSIQKELVINEFMAIVTCRIEDPEEYTSELLG